jgi:hypothetical protein
MYYVWAEEGLLVVGCWLSVVSPFMPAGSITRGAKGLLPRRFFLKAAALAAGDAHLPGRAGGEGLVDPGALDLKRCQTPSRFLTPMQPNLSTREAGEKPEWFSMKFGLKWIELKLGCSFGCAMENGVAA